MPSRISYSASNEWFRALLRLLRVPIVFLISALASFCAFKDSSALIGGTPTATLDGRSPPVRLALWDADLMPTGERLPVRVQMSRSFRQTVDSDVLVLYDVPSFAQLLKLRDALGLFGYTAVMSNFFCGVPRGGAKWPVEIAVLSRYPISQAVEFDSPVSRKAPCANAGPHTDGPVIASQTRMTIPPHAGEPWPSARHDGGPALGPGLLTVRIDSIRTAVVALHVPAAFEYPDAGPLALGAMRRAIVASAKAWVVRERAQFDGYAFLAMGDFAVNPGVETTAEEPAQMGAQPDADAVDALLIGGPSGAINLTSNLLAEGAAPGVFPHSDRIYLWSSVPDAFGVARRADNSFGSRAFPLVVRSSGATCTVGPLLTWRRRSPGFRELFEPDVHRLRRRARSTA